MERTIQKRVEVERSWVSLDIYGETDGPAIVVIPGVMADAASWAGVARSLRGWPTVVVVNRRGRLPAGPLTSSYDLHTEVGDAAAVLAEFSDVRTVLGWSYGGLVALHLTRTVAVQHLVAYEPVMAPFGASALPDLEDAHDDRNLDRTVEVALGQVANMTNGVIDSLRAEPGVWAGLREVSSPVYAETRSLNLAPVPQEFASKAERVDLILGERNRGRAPYGTTFDDVRRLTPRAVVHELPGQANLAHLEAPDHLAALVSRLRTVTI